MNKYSINEAKEAIKTGIRGYLAKDKNGNYLMKEVNRLPFYMEGSPGIGKTQMTSQIADELGIGFVSFSITHHSRNTLLGLPVISDMDGVRYTEYTMSEIIAAVLDKYNSGQREGILLLDEFNCMSETIMPVMLSFLQTKNIGSHYLPEGWVIVLCGNQKAFNKSARSFDFAVLDRLRVLYVDFAIEDFLIYAMEHEFEDEIREFVRINPDSAYVLGSDREDSLATCRSWENLDIAIKMLKETGGEPDERMIRQFIKSDAVSRKFYRFYQLKKKEGFTDADAGNVIEGREKGRYIKLIKNMDYGRRMEVLELLLNTVIALRREKKLSPSSIRDCLDRVILLFKEVGDISCLEKLFNMINANSPLVEILTKNKSGEYLSLVDMVYYPHKKQKAAGG